jgi:hypothetical protein
VQVTEGDGYYLGRVLINAQVAAPPSVVQKMQPAQWLTEVAGSRTLAANVGRAHTIMKGEIQRRLHGRAGKPLGRLVFTAVGPLTLSLLFAVHSPPAHAADITVVGTPGVDGAPGSDGGPGGDATATTPPNSDPSNTANATGGPGGAGGLPSAV